MNMSRIVQVLGFICSFFVFGIASATLEQIWLAPSNPVGNETNVLEPFFAAKRGEWFTSEDAIGGRSYQAVVMDSNKTIWIAGGTFQRDTAVFGVWNYNPITDKYRWVWKVDDGNDAYYPGELDVESDLNSPGALKQAPTTIDSNDNIWVYSNSFEMWMFNTSSWMWVRKQGLYNETFSPSFGADPGQPGTDVWPASEYSAMVIDSHGDLWLLGGQAEGNVRNNVWHFNTTSSLWRFVSGDKLADPTPSNSTYFGGFQYSSCDIDDEDKVWCYGGDSVGIPSTLWMFDTRAATWIHKFGSFNAIEADFLPRVIVDNAFDPQNSPGVSYGNFINRRDGTFLLVVGYGLNATGANGGVQAVWLYDITLNQWKHVLGDMSSIYNEGTYITRGQPGSTRPASIGFGAQSGLNFDGDVFIHGGNYDDNNFYYLKDIWLIPNDQCSSSTANKCDTNAECTEKLIGYSCQCKQGYEGDGFTCTFIPIPQSPKSATSNVARLIYSVSWIFLVALLA